MIDKMNTKGLTLIIVFIALTIALNVAGPKIPAPYAPFLFYELWEIPIVLVFLAIGPKAGIVTATINAIILIAIFPGALLLGPVYNLIAVLAMLLGIYIPYKIAIRGCKTENISDFLRQHIKMLSISATTLAVILRVAIMTVVNYWALPQSPPIGFYMTKSATIAYLPLLAVFNATVVLYTVPIALGITVAITYRFKLK